jgi:hypothetical protein
VPVVGDLFDHSVAQVRRHVVQIGGELQLRDEVTLFEPAREPVDPFRPRALGGVERNANRDALQRNALFSFSKKPSSAL